MNHSTLLQITLFVLTVCMSAVASAKTFYAPAFCEPQDLHLTVENISLESQLFWVQRHSNTEVFEEAFEVPAQESINIPGYSLITESKSFSLKTQSENLLHFELNCQGRPAPLLTDTVTPHVIHYLPPGAITVKVSLLNLYLNPQSVTLRFSSSQGQTLGTEEVRIEKYYDTLELKLTVPNGTQKLEVLGTNRLHSWVYSQSQRDEVFISGIYLGPLQLQAHSEGSYFLVSTQDTPARESFVVHITDSEMIEKAREQIDSAGFPKIVVARIGLGHGGFNRSFQRNDRAPFSWSVTQVDALADFAHIDCDGSPELIEERLQERLSEGGRICFWRYRITKELTALEVQQGKLATP